MLLRIRTTKPAFFGHLAIYQLEERTGLPIRVAYHALWSACDRAGRFEWKPEVLKRALIPHDRCDMRDVLSALAGGLFIVQYVVQGRAYGWCPTMPVHQSINAQERASVLPPPPANVVRWYQEAILAQNMGASYTQANPLADPSDPSYAMLSPAPQTPSNGARQDSAAGVVSVTSMNGNGLQNHERDANPLATREDPVTYAPSPRHNGTSLPLALTQGRALEEQQQKDSLGDMGDRLEERHEPATPAEQTALARAEAGREGQHAGALALTGQTQQALPRIRGKRDVDAIVKRLGTVLAEVAEGSRQPLGQEQWLKLACEMVFAYWAKTHGKEQSYLAPEGDPREKKTQSRLKENGGDISELCYAVDGVKLSKYHMGDNPDHRRYDGLETILRDRVQVEKFAALMPAYRRGELHPLVRKYAGALLGLEGMPAAQRERLERDLAGQAGAEGQADG